MAPEKATAEKSAALERSSHSLKVIGVGFPRTGTRSLHTALTILGFTPCHHMQTDILTAMPPYTFARKWLQVFRDRTATSRQKLMASIYANGRGAGSYAASVDFPGSLFVEDMLTLYPDAKFILTTRESGEVWKQSFDDTIGLMRRPWWRLATTWMPSQWAFVQGMGHEWEDQCVRRYGEGIYTLGGGWKAYEGHNAWVRSVIPKENLLDCGPDVGWERLCGFLGMKVPEEVGEYPRANERQAIRRWFFEGAVAGVVLWCFWLSVFGFLSWRYLS